MLEVIRSLARFGPLSIETRNRQWKVGCLVRLPAGVAQGFVSVYDDRLYTALEQLIPLAKDKEKELWIEFRKPKQQAFNYGTGEGGEGHP